MAVAIEGGELLGDVEHSRSDAVRSATLRGIFKISGESEQPLEQRALRRVQGGHRRHLAERLFDAIAAEFRQ